ncbi:Septin-domain-containing protein [Halteromyces radiatus]|uniref:Septin-domain-containing protein n=1 Tax=Halteromyces radiatus TaxID=101107 RepID=UPI0022205E4E|nr:Septin-domain-containing protein [Halteromyces radiatus]KAI8089778.1 Septin-domain-containing protein [Halteromyces radiatus]
MTPRSRKPMISHFNVMVVGFSGVGKTSFVRTLLESLKMKMTKDKRETMFQPTGNGKALIEGPLERTLVPYTVSVDAEVDGEKMVLTLIDTPGFQTDYIVDKQLHDILGYIEHQFDLTLAEENKVKRNPKAVDTQVHACLYFVDPSKTDLDDYDIRVLSKLAKRVNVIPVIGKADTLTLAQRNRLRPTIIKSIYNTHKLPLYGMPEDEEEENEDEYIDDSITTETNNDDEKTNKDDKVNRKESLDVFLQQFDYEKEDDEVQTFIDYLRAIPFTFIACEEDPTTGQPIKMKSTDGKTSIQLGRDYGWGTIDCLSDEYSDFNKLKTMLLVSHRRILMSETVERYYEQYRTERLLQKRATKMKSMVVSKKILEDLTQI